MGSAMIGASSRAARGPAVLAALFGERGVECTRRTGAVSVAFHRSDPPRGIPSAAALGEAELDALAQLSAKASSILAVRPSPRE